MTPPASPTTPRADTLMRLEQEVGVLIRRVRKVINSRASAVHPDLQPASYLMLSYLQEQGPLRASVVAELFDIDKGAISRQVSHLVDLGLVVRNPDPDDGRASLLSVTPLARERLEPIKEVRRQWVSDQLEGWSDDEVERLAVQLGRYNEALTGRPEPDPAGA
ncbi:MarR family winged helix-turn-helix transcriptional regulator [Nocardioides bruguierae]|uniref:MarR family transcriptional regulator n=1 Tax=Nocardioides bruguierae TaxID=2945102 RepID=A0A9X2IFM1_9ACTN|nr:MarR family transcriptional regulator [Nocardioides bruguierae]MCL8027658.1 MarR family transcriptional regulator [Nocardioides bruguierae]MCM0621981.1 MarR family transcriptional regulator [Nocardioides bruguierae]